ncbi:RES domain-containing protein [Aliikangiella maris]|uniref:RES domain-containing protein n=2 Tax=Aliikangiella maris TaxID=3162458 RepID=A0ABV3MSU2_9GAMM
MAKFPRPKVGQQLPELQANDIITIPSERILWRIYNRRGEYPVKWYDFRYFGPTASRFDHQLRDAEQNSFLQDRGIMYVGHNGPVCVAEFFQVSRVIDRHFREPWLVGFKPLRPLKLLNLKSLFVTRVGTSTAINSGPKKRARAWSRLFYESYPQIDGLCYGSSMHNYDDSFALYERALDAIPESPHFHSALSDRRMEKILFKVSVNINYRIV